VALDRTLSPAKLLAACSAFGLMDLRAETVGRGTFALSCACSIVEIVR